LDRRPGERRATRKPEERPPGSAPPGRAQGGEGAAMDLFGIEGEEKRTGRAIGDAPPGHQSS
ncbi:MAG TPA: hypothetical protein VFU04_03155, partial [Solirubrobacterales bacterium]|nr:hypothetical protein [Solirubrobacterales bacterium]